MDLAKDIRQEVYTTLVTKHNQIKDAKNIKTWLLTVTNRKCLDVFRSRKKEILAPTAEEATAVLEEEIDEAHDVQDCLKGILAHMPEKYAKPLQLANIEGMKHKEIAIRLNLPLSTVKTRIQRARKMVVQGYVDCCDFRVNHKGHLVGVVKSKADCKVCR